MPNFNDDVTIRGHDLILTDSDEREVARLTALVSCAFACPG